MGLFFPPKLANIHKIISIYMPVPVGKKRLYSNMENERPTIFVQEFGI